MGSEEGLAPGTLAPVTPSTVQLGTVMGNAWGRGDRGRAAVLRGHRWSLHGQLRWASSHRPHSLQLPSWAQVEGQKNPG